MICSIVPIAKLPYKGIKTFGLLMFFSSGFIIFAFCSIAAGYGSVLFITFMCYTKKY